VLIVLVHHDVDKHAVMFRVACEGLQVPAVDFVRIFEEDSDVAAGQSPTGANVGLGLYVARALARQMGGDLDALIEPSGSGQPYVYAFALSLPALEGQK